MDVSHDALVGIAKSFGLFYLIAMSVGVVVYAFWPSLGPRFDRAAGSVLDDEDGPVTGRETGRADRSEDRPEDRPEGSPCR